jgi:predicted ferric reductase
MRDAARAAGWLIVYLVLALAPLALALIQLDPGRGFWVNFSVALGFVGLALLGLQFALAARSSRATTPFGIDVVLQFHREIGYVALAFVLAHPLILFVWDSRFLNLLNVVSAPMRAKFAVASVVLLIVLIVSSVWRRRLRLGYVTWQMLHAVLGIAVVVFGLLHVLLIGYYVDQPWERGLWIAYSAAFVLVTIWVRLVKPVQRYRRRWRVMAVEEQPAHSHRLTLELVDPASYGASGFSFEPGQFAWIRSGRSPFSMSYNPFSFSSSAERPDRIQFTIKSSGDYSTSLHELAVGETVYVDGPHGSFSSDRHEGPGFALIAGGVGITPMLSILETMADRDDVRPCVLFIGVRSECEVICADQIEALRARLSLDVITVISEPGPSWAGERGYLTADILDRHLPPRRHRLQYFLCGPAPLMDTAEGALDTLGVPGDRVHSERFAMV